MKQNPRASWTRSLAILALLVIAFFATDRYAHTTPEPSPPAPARPVTKQILPDANAEARFIPTPADQEWVQNNLLDILEWAKRDYPVESVRALVVETMAMVASKRIAMSIDLPGHPAGRIVSAAGFWDDRGQAVLVWFYPGMRYVQECTRGDREQYKDEVVTTLLHEAYHITKQPPYTPGSVPRADMLNYELAAWWWQIKYVNIPMQEAGRFNGPHSVTQETALRAYKAAAGDPTSEAWRSIAEHLYFKE